MDSNKKILPIDSDDNDMSIVAFNEYLEADTIRKKNQNAIEIERMGDFYLKEIDRKKLKKEKIKTELITYIIKHSNNRYTINDTWDLNTYSFEDVRDIYNQLKIENRSIFSKIFHFIFNFN